MEEVSVSTQEIHKLRPSFSIPNPIREDAIDTFDAERKTKSKTKGILLEPALFGAVMAMNLGQTSLQNFYLITACTVDLANSTEACYSPVMEHELEAASQRVVTGVNISRSFVGSLMSTMILLFVGPWSDCSGRRQPLLIMPLLGMSIMTTGVLLMITFPGASTIQVLYMVQIPISLGGNFGLLLAAAFSHIGDICHATGRDVMRTMGVHRAAIQVANVTGSVCGPLLYHNFGFYGVFPIVLLLQLTSLLYVLWRVKDVNVNNENKVSVLNWRLPIQAIQCLFRKRDGGRRTIILLMLIVTLGDRVVLSAEVMLAYMYYRLKFGWNDILFGSFIAYRNIISFIGTLIILTILKRRLKLTDEMVGLLSCMSFVLSSSGLIFSTTTIVVFMLPLIGIISQGSQVVQRPIINKQILPNEQGKIYSVFGALESATQTMSSPLYSLLYKTTVKSMRDAWLLPGIALAFIQSFAYIISKGIQENIESKKKHLHLEALVKAEHDVGNERSQRKPNTESNNLLNDNENLKEINT